MEQATYLVTGGAPYRDQAMATNIDRILQQNPGARLVLWAHSYHVSRTAGAMGSYLADGHGADYVVFTESPYFRKSVPGACLFHPHIHQLPLSSHLAPITEWPPACQAAGHAKIRGGFQLVIRRLLCQGGLQVHVSEHGSGPPQLLVHRAVYPRRQLSPPS